MAVWSYGNQILADVLINLLEQFILFPRVRFQQDIDQVIFQYPNAQCPVYHHLMFPEFPSSSNSASASRMMSSAKLREYNQLDWNKKETTSMHVVNPKSLPPAYSFESLIRQNDDLLKKMLAELA